jgi:hypothetical protein
MTVPPGHLAVKMANANHGAAAPGEILVFPVEEARALTRAGWAWEVRVDDPG